VKRRHYPNAIYADRKGSDQREILRICRNGNTICLAEWNNLNLSLRQHLKADYDPRDLTKLTFRAIPETEDEYDIEAELALPLGSVPTSTVTKKSRQLPQPSEHLKKSTGKCGLTFTLEPPTAGFSAEDVEALAMFDSLDTEGRLAFWSECLSRHSRQK
jgi:hypothetical protein